MCKYSLFMLLFSLCSGIFADGTVVPAKEQTAPKKQTVSEVNEYDAFKMTPFLSIGVACEKEYTSQSSDGKTAVKISEELYFSGFMLDLLSLSSERVFYGFYIGTVGLANTVSGLQIAVFGNRTRICNGLQIAPFMNASWEANAFQISLFGNYCNDFTGWQISLMNQVGKIPHELQPAGKEITDGDTDVPFQIGLVNRIEHNDDYSFQAGVLNSAFGRGLQIGVLNYSKDAFIKILPIINFNF